MAAGAATGVLADGALDVAALGAALRDTGVRVEPLDRPPAGPDVVGVVSWERPVGEAELADLPALRVLVTPSVGFDHLDLDAAPRHGGTWACHVPDHCVEEMADGALALVLALMRGVVALDRHVRAGASDATAAGPLRRIRGTRLGVVGHGRIGAAPARRAGALGFEVWGCDPAVVDAERLALMPSGALLVNTARAALVDTPALLDEIVRAVLEDRPPAGVLVSPGRR